jgi:integrase
VIGEWLPLSEPGTSDITTHGRKWLYGIDWRQVSSDLVLKHRLSKSLRGRHAIAHPHAGKCKEFDLKLYPMVIEELARMPIEKRIGPMIVDEGTGLPYKSDTYRERWRLIATQLGIPARVQNRDSRAGAITEGIDAADGNMEAVRNAAGHAKVETTQRYNRAPHRQTAQVAVLRARKRPANGMANGSNGGE